MIGFLSLLMHEMKRNNEVIKSTIIKDAKLKVLDVRYSPMKSFLIPDFTLYGDLKEIYVNQSCVIEFEYEGHRYISKNARFYLEKIRNADINENEELIITHDIIINEYRYGYKMVDVYYEEVEK